MKEKIMALLKARKQERLEGEEIRGMTNEELDQELERVKKEIEKEDKKI